MHQTILAITIQTLLTFFVAPVAEYGLGLLKALFSEFAAFWTGSATACAGCPTCARSLNFSIAASAECWCSLLYRMTIFLPAVLMDAPQ
jgi:hypothetical protein